MEFDAARRAKNKGNLPYSRREPKDESANGEGSTKIE
jgi:hypothetical protein